MPSSLDRRLYLPCDAGKLFALVADVEQYPRFVPGWRRVSVAERGPDRLLVDQLVKVGPGQWQFRTEAWLDPPREIRISSVNAPFGYLSIAWSFDPLGDQGCAVGFSASYDLGNSVLHRVASGTLERRLLEVMGAFEARARRTCSVTGSGAGN